MATEGPSTPAPLAVRGRKRGLKVIVAIDFGTTFSGVAYANTQEPEKQTLIRNWGPGLPISDKAPTILRYDNAGITGPFKWGFQVKKQLKPGEKVHEWFKLGLCPEYEERRAAESELIRKYPSTTALEPVKGDEAEKLVMDYLSSLKTRVDDYFKGLDTRVNELPREYVVTVPAIWDDKEQHRTRSCAQRAGLGKGSRLQIISEPEAAAVYALDSLPRIGLSVGETFVICDAGGGTVDLTSYTIRSLDPINLDGAGKGSGGLCGSMFLNRIFAKYLQKKLKDYRGGWDQGLLSYAIDEFDRRIKPVFTGDDEDSFQIMVRGLRDSESHGIRDGNLELTSKELRKNVFDEVITKIQGLVRDQIANTSGKVKSVLLAGGFGQSVYLKQQLERMEVIKRKGILVQQFENSNTAIVRGALIGGLTRQEEDDGMLRVRGTRVSSRIAGKSYGICANDLWSPEDGPSRRKTQPTGEDLAERMQWFLKEGESMRDRVPRPFQFEKDREVSRGPMQTASIHVFSSEKRDAEGVIGPPYPDSPGVRKCGSFEMDLRDIDVPIERHNGVDLYVAKIDIEMTLDSASLSFQGIYAKGTAEEKRSEKKLIRFA